MVCGFCIPLVKFIILLRKVLPGGTTAQAKFSSPISDCSSCSVAVRLHMKRLRISFNDVSLSSGNLTSHFTVSISIPKKGQDCGWRYSFFLFYWEVDALS